MHFFFDESGAFTPASTPAEHRAAVVMGVTIADTDIAGLSQAFANFEMSLTARERQRGEPKGHLLSRVSRQTLCDLLAGFPGVSLTPVTLELSALHREYREEFPRRMHDVLDSHSERMIFESGKQGVRQLADQFRNLSVEQGMRLYAWSRCIRQALQYALIFLSAGPYADSWNSVRFELDRVQQRAGSREELVASTMIYAWLWGWSARNPFHLVEEIHTTTHPFVMHYDDGQTIDLNKLIKRNLHWVSSSENWGVRLADMTASIVYQAVRDLDDRNGSASLFASLMRSSFYAHRDGPGLFTPMSEASEALTAKYVVLAEVLKRNQSTARGRPRVHATGEKG